MLRSLRRGPTLFYLAFCVLAIAAASARRPHILVDDAAISFRYAKRFAQGLGLTYNDHERVMGFSNPLYTLILAALRTMHADLEPATEWLSLFLYVATLLLSLYLAWLLSDLFGAAVAGILLISNAFFGNQMLSGMESALAAFLAMLFLVLVFHEQDALAAIILGLAMTNKLDAGFMALAFLLSWRALYRTIPFRISLTAIAVFLPWGLFALFYYGSAIPNSLQTKVSVHSTQLAFNHWWIVDLFRHNLAWWPLLVSALLFPVFLRSLEVRGRLVGLVLLAWFLLHAGAYSLVNLGDYYPWYLTVLFPPMTVLGSAFIARSLSAVKVAPLRSALAILVLALVAGWGVHWRQFDPAAIRSWEAFDNDRRLAGVFIDQYGDKREVVASGFGWVAYEVDNPFDDGSGLNSRVMRNPVDYVVIHGKPPYDTGSSVPSLEMPGFIPLATLNLASDLFPGYSWFSVFGRADSRIARSGKRFLQYRLFQLEADPRTRAGASSPRLQGNDLVVRLSDVAGYRVVNQSHAVRLVYTPTLAGRPDQLPSDRVTFAVGVNGDIVHRHDVMAGEAPQPVSAVLAGAEQMPEFRLSLMASGATSPTEVPVVRWRNVKVVVGDAHIDPARIYDATLRETWQKHNPVGPARRRAMSASD